MSLKIRNWRIFVSPETNEPGKIIVNCTPNKYHYYTLHSLSVFSLTKSVQLIMEINVTYRLVGDLLADNSLMCRLQGQCMIFKNNINSVSLRVVIFFKTMYNKTIITFNFCDILNNQGLSNVISLCLQLG